MVAAATGRFYGQAMIAGDIYTVAGGGKGGLANGIPATDATLARTAGAAVDGGGNLLIAALHDSRVRVVAAATGTFYGVSMSAGDIYTVAGGGRAEWKTAARPPEPGCCGRRAWRRAPGDNGLIRTVTG